MDPIVYLCRINDNSFNTLQRKKKWSQSLPPLENDGGSMLQSQSSPGISFESDMHVGHTTITETTLNGPRGGGRQYQQNNQNQNQNNHRHNQSNTTCVNLEPN